MDRLEPDHFTQRLERRGPSRQAIDVVRDEDDRLSRLAKRGHEGGEGGGAAGALAAKTVARLVEHDELPPARQRREELARVRERLRNSTAKRDVSDLLRVSFVRGVHLDDGPPHIRPERERRARLPGPRIALEDYGGLLWPPLLPRERPSPGFPDRRWGPAGFLTELSAVRS